MSTSKPLSRLTVTSIENFGYFLVHRCRHESNSPPQEKQANKKQNKIIQAKERIMNIIATMTENYSKILIKAKNIDILETS